MSNDNTEDPVFEIYHEGKFLVSDGKMNAYVGGKISSLESKSEALFTNLTDSLDISLFGQRVWYKFPYDPFSEVKLICNRDGDANFQRLCLATKWTKAVEIFLEKEEVGDDGNDNDEIQADCNVNDGNNNDENLEGDEDEHYNSEGTPPNSDCEDGGIRHLRCKKGSGEIRLEQVFDTIAEFKDAVVDYALKHQANVKFTRWGPEKSEVKCSLGGLCKFRIYCSYDEPIGMYKIKTFNDKHACITDGFSKVVKDGIIAKGPKKIKESRARTSLHKRRRK